MRRHTADQQWIASECAANLDRFIAVWNQQARAHRVYLTTASRRAIPADNAAALHAMRWEIELLFRELKSQLRIEDMPTGNRAAVEVLLYASLLALAFGRTTPDAPSHFWRRVAVLSRVCAGYRLT